MSAVRDSKHTVHTSIDSNVELAESHQLLDGSSPPKVLPVLPFWKTVSITELGKGWRLGASTGACLAYLVLLLNICLTIWGSFKSSENQGHIFIGNCKKAEHLNMGIHLIINVLSTLLLGASNYSMQCLCAPTRKAIVTAHRQGKWLDIGVQSLRNLTSISRLRLTLWICLGVSSVPLHLLFNSMFYLSSSNQDYELYFASEDWLHGAWYDSYNLHARGAYTHSASAVTYYTDPAKMQARVVHNTSQFEELDVGSCIDTYARSYMVDRSNVILISEPLYNDSRIPKAYYEYIARNSSLYWITPGHDLNQPLYNSGDRYGWICDHWDIEPAGCDSSKVKERAQAGNWTVYGYNVTGCMSQKVEEHCSVNFNLVIGIIVILVNLGKALCITAVCFLLVDQPIITIGDAVALFMRSPDKLTAGHCLATKDDIQANWPEMERKPKRYSPHYCRRWQAAGKKSWISFFILFGSAIIIILALFIYAIVQLRKGYDQGSFSAIWALGFGTATSSNLISGPGWKLALTGTSAVLSSVIVANMPQVLLSGLYLALNNIITRIQLAVEWASFATERKALRVSDTRHGSQRTKHFLQMPYRFAIPLMVLSGTLHWLVSQSIFLASVDTRNAVGVIEKDESVATCGYSPLGMIFTMIVGVLVAIFTFAIGFKKLAPGIPVVGSCSIGIAAACHPPRDGGDVGKPLLWGAVPETLLGGMNAECKDGEKVGHCSFSCNTVDTPVPGELYA